MKLLLLTFFAFILFSVSVFAQSDLPIQGKLSDLQNKKTAYIAAETTGSRELIEKHLVKDKSFEIASDAEKADFIIEFKQIEKSTPPRYGAGAYTDIAEMIVYFYNAEKRKVIAWSKTNDAFKKGWGTLKKNEETLTKLFLKEIRKL